MCGSKFALGQWEVEDGMHFSGWSDKHKSVH